MTPCPLASALQAVTTALETHEPRLIWRAAELCDLAYQERLSRMTEGLPEPLTTVLYWLARELGRWDPADTEHPAATSYREHHVRRLVHRAAVLVAQERQPRREVEACIAGSVEVALCPCGAHAAPEVTR